MVALQRTGASAGDVGEWFDVMNGAVGHGVHLQPGPEIFDRIQFRGAAGKELDPDPPALLSNEIPRRPLRCAASPSQTIRSFPGMWRSRWVKKRTTCGERMAPGNRRK